jgi:hypothetical protein
VIFVADTTVHVTASAPVKMTRATFTKSLPVRVTVVPAPAVVGLRLVITGAIRNDVALDTLPVVP